MTKSYVTALAVALLGARTKVPKATLAALAKDTAIPSRRGRALAAT